MQIILAQNSEGNHICFRPGNREDMADPLMMLIQMRYSEGWYKDSPSAMEFVKRIMDAYYESKPLVCCDDVVLDDPDYEGLALDFLESRSQFAKEKIEILETEN